ncbi:hypothetical protein [Sphaerotilus sp.]|uniref:hypothetical protein n=1 Tax=Sphaerotilus sp. TaxID=2093942 RepID=UPI00286DD74A|nr:hypothetical protein [Sphaerotilus sp.]
MTRRLSGDRHGSRQAQWRTCGAIVQDIADTTRWVARRIRVFGAWPLSLLLLQASAVPLLRSVRLSHSDSPDSRLY